MGKGWLRHLHRNQCSREEGVVTGLLSTGEALMVTAATLCLVTLIYCGHPVPGGTYL